MSEAQQIRPGMLYQGTKPVRDPEYRRFIKRLPCVVCLKTWWIDPCSPARTASDRSPRITRAFHCAEFIISSLMSANGNSPGNTSWTSRRSRRCSGISMMRN